MHPCQTVQHTADHDSPAGSSPTVFGSLASAAPCAPAEVSASPPVKGQPGGDLDTSYARRLAIWHCVSGHGAPAGTIHPAGQFSSMGAAGGAEPLAAVAVYLFGLSPGS